jgi:preprotein translocase subunit YajC
VKNYLPFLLVVLVFVILIMVSTRNRRRAATQESTRSQRLTVGTQVMTTSGLYGTITGRNDDDTVQLQVAPGIEVKWALAALRDAESLAAQFRPGITGGGVEMRKRSHEDPDAAA